MGYELHKASAPGSFMISGEHAILRDKLGLVAAIEQRIEVILTPRADNQIIIHSDKLGRYQTDLESLVIVNPFEFVLASIESQRPYLKRGFELVIYSEFSHTMGLSSSAAVTVATLAVLVNFTGRLYSEFDYFEMGCKVIRSVQGIGSGADVAAAIWGKIVAITTNPQKIDPIDFQAAPWHLIYTGYKTPTSQVVTKVNEAVNRYPVFYQALFDAIDTASQVIISGLKTQDYQLVGEWMKRHNALQMAMQLVCPESQQILMQCQMLPNIYGAKVSGAGLGDCILVLGDLPAATFAHQMAVKVAERGLVIHE